MSSNIYLHSERRQKRHNIKQCHYVQIGRRDTQYNSCHLELLTFNIAATKQRSYIFGMVDRKKIHNEYWFHNQENEDEYFLVYPKEEITKEEYQKIVNDNMKKNLNIKIYE